MRKRERRTPRLALRTNQASRWYPSIILWIVLDIGVLVIRRPRSAGTLIAIAIAAPVVIVFNALGLFADPLFALPVAPAFVLFGAAALLGPRGEGRDIRQAPAPR